MPPPQPPYYSNWDSPFSYAPPPTPLPFGMSRSDLAGMGPGGAILQTMAPMISEWSRDRFGAFAFTFGSGINPATTEYSRSYLQQMNAGRQAGAVADQTALDGLLRGLGVMIGHKPDMAATRAAGDGRVRFDAAGERMISRLASDGSEMLRFLAAMMPDAVDAALPRGSMAVASNYMTAANRYMVDPTTGRRLSEDSGFTERVLNPLIARGPAATDGLRAGRVGAMYGELARRGVVGGGGDFVATREAYDGLMGVHRLDDPNAPQMTQGQVREINADRVRRQLEGYSKTIAAVNEIFAENGNANAPMAELIQGLEAMTQGGLSSYSSEQLTRVVRTFQGAGQEFGLTSAAMQAMTGQAGAQLSAVGGHRGLAAPAALYAAAASNAYGSRGYQVGPETGGMNDQLVMTMARTTGFAGSEMANLMGALEVQSRYLGPDGRNTDLGKVVAAMKSGQVTTTLGDGSTFDLRTANQAQITGLASRSGLSAQSMMNQLAFGEAQNRASAVSNPQFDVARRALQRNEAERALTSMFGSQMDAALGGKATTRQFLDALYEETNAPGVTSLDQAMGKVGAKFGIGADGMATLGPLLDSVGAQWARSAGVGDVGGLAGIRNLSPQFQDSAAGALGRADAAGQRASALARTNPQGAMAGAANAVNNFGRLEGAGGFVRPDGTIDWQRGIAMGALGGVTMEEAMKALGAQTFNAGDTTGNTINGILGGIGNALDGANQQQGRAPGLGGPGGAGVVQPVRMVGDVVIRIIDNGVQRNGRMMGDQVVPGGVP